MQDKVKRFIAVFFLIVPGFMATYGFLLMKNAFFAQFGPDELDPHFMWGKFIIGLVLFALGVSFIGGWILFRDRKHNYVAPRFKAKRK
jgi:threonine/homoserine/homoserine lactone efflux protein